jgi:hypothetical protein
MGGEVGEKRAMDRSSKAGGGKKRDDATGDARVVAATRDEAARLRDIEADITRDLRKGEKLAYANGRRVDDIMTNGLHHGAGFATLEAYLEKRFPQGARTLLRYRRVALKFEEATVHKHGATKLDLGLTYIGHTPEEEQARDIPMLLVRVPDAKTKVIARVPFADCSTQSLERAIDAAKKKKPAPTDTPEEKRALKLAAELEKRTASPKGKRILAPRVRARATEGGEPRFDLLGVALSDIERVATEMLAFARARGAKRSA